MSYSYPYSGLVPSGWFPVIISFWTASSGTPSIGPLGYPPIRYPQVGYPQVGYPPLVIWDTFP